MPDWIVWLGSLVAVMCVYGCKASQKKLKKKKNFKQFQTMKESDQASLHIQWCTHASYTKNWKKLFWVLSTTTCSLQADDTPNTPVRRWTVNLH